MRTALLVAVTAAALTTTGGTASAAPAAVDAVPADSGVMSISEARASFAAGAPAGVNARAATAVAAAAGSGGSAFTSLSPTRVLDTRNAGGALGPGGTRTVDLSSRVPANATAVVLNVTGVSPSTSTVITVWPNGAARPTASNLNLVRGQTAANMATVAFGPDKRLSLRNNAGYVHVIIDVAGYFAPPPVACAVDCVYSWGANNNAQLGIGAMGGYSGEPNRVDGNSQFTSVGGGISNGYGLRADGTVWAWGTNGASTLGNGLDYGVAVKPVRVNALANIRTIAIGAYNGYAIDSVNRAWAWGYAEDGELGNGSVTQVNSPVPVSLPNDVTQIAAGHLTTFALRSNGTVWVWGANGGSFGNGTYGTGCDTTPVGAGCRAATPIQVPGLTGVVSIAASYNAAFAVKSDGTVWAWGFNAEGELGIGTAGGPACYANPLRANCMALSPVRIPGLTGVRKIVTGGTSATYALMNDGTVTSWGYNAAGQLGNGTTGGECADETAPNCVRTTPGPVTGLTDVVDVAAGGAFAMARRADGTLWTWGQNSQGQLGGQWSPTDVPTQVPDVSGVTAVGAGLTTAYAIR